MLLVDWCFAPEVFGVGLWQPLSEFLFSCRILRIIGEVFPLVWVVMDGVEFLSTVAIVDVVKLPRADRVVHANIDVEFEIPRSFVKYAKEE